MSKLSFHFKDEASFFLEPSALNRLIYFPLCGVDARSVKSSLTPYLSGDIKVDKKRFLTKPVSREDLRNVVRNFYVKINNETVCSIAEINTEVSVEAGFLWHKLVKRQENMGVEFEVMNFVPVTGEAELMSVEVKNVSEKTFKITPTFAIPLFARPLVNKHDHEHVSSLLHRTYQLPEGVFIKPTMIFDEEGHKANPNVYYVFGCQQEGRLPVGSFPTVLSFLGEKGSLNQPEAVLKSHDPKKLYEEAIHGQEAMGALRFCDTFLAPGESKTYIMVMGIDENLKGAQKIFNEFNSKEKFEKAWAKNQAYWVQKSKAVKVNTGHKVHDAWMQWVSIQPVLRRIFGCSFLPDHDYGKGGRGWRDIWQDLLSLILIEPESIRKALINNFMGVRIDGTNATIIGSAPGEYIADRNAIARVWMDHGAWPLSTLLLYIHQTGDFNILFEEIPYFKDCQLSRAKRQDLEWDPKDGHQLRNRKRKVHQGTIIEHTLVQHLVQFFNVGEHNHIRLENADWNDGLDMACARGESVAFTSFYAGNLLDLADLLETLAQQKGGQTELTLSKEVLILLDSLTNHKVNYENYQTKQKLLFDKYFKTVEPKVSGQKVKVKVKDAVKDLRTKGQWIFDHIRRTEKVKVKTDGQIYQWFNGYYDNQGKRVEGQKKGRIWMTLTGQVFTIMSGLAKREDIHDIVQSVSAYLKDKKWGGFRLNTDFGVSPYLDLGRAFGFAYGTKENGAFFSHMNVMYAYGLYKRGFVKEGKEVLDSIYKMCLDIENSKIYPGIPEYFDSRGQGMYHYLTGSASWLVLTNLTQVFGVRGRYGDLILNPKLTKEEFDREGRAFIHCRFAGKELKIIYSNPKSLEFHSYKITSIAADGIALKFEVLAPPEIRLSRSLIRKLPSKTELQVLLDSES